jgi:ribosome-binding factor A
VIHFKRADRVGGQVQKELSDLLQKEIRDPRLDSVTIMRVRITDDLRSARIYFSVPEGDERKLNALAGFKSASGYLRRKLSRRLELRHIPELEFLYDESFDEAIRVDKVLKAIRDGVS